MAKINIEKIKKLVEQLSSEERLELFHFISELPDSGIHTGNLTQPPYEIKENEQTEEDLEITDDFVIIYTLPEVRPTGVAVILKGKTVFQVFYYPENYYEGRLKIKRSYQNAPPTEELMNRIRSIITKHGGQVKDEDIVKASIEATKQIFEAETIRISNEISDRLPDMVSLLVNAVIKIIEISIHNSFSESTGQFDKVKKLEDIEKILEPYWRHIKDKHLGITQGGARNFKHIWTPEDLVCLKTNFDRLKPIWTEAKRIAVQAQKSKESTRSHRWREEVKRAYPELPDDLIERFATPRSDEAKPSDIALINAARLCLPVTYTTRRLRSELKKLNFKKP